MMRVSHAAAVFAVVASFALAGCMSMLDSSLPEAPGFLGCAKNSGAYYLPKKVLRVQVYKNATRGFGLQVEDALTSVADRSRLYCLDYLASLTSRDEIGITRSEQGLLRRIYTRADDKTVDIVKDVIDIGLLAAANQGRALVFGTNADVLIGDYTFDPFDPEQAAMINAALRPHGYCVFIQGYTFPSSISPHQWCERPQVGQAVLKAPALEFIIPPVEASTRGVLYRPNMLHTLYVLRKSDPYGRRPWSIAMKREIEAPNVSPAFAVEVERSLFVNRVTDLEFDDGVLTNISINKPSELAAFVEIPLALARAITALPAQIVILKINDANNRAALIQAQKELLSVQRQYNNDVDALLKVSKGLPLPGLVGDLPPEALDAAKQRAIANCLVTGAPRDVCEAKWPDFVQ